MQRGAVKPADLERCVDHVLVVFRNGSVRLEVEAVLSILPELLDVESVHVMEVEIAVAGVDGEGLRRVTSEVSRMRDSIGSVRNGVSFFSDLSFVTCTLLP